MYHKFGRSPGRPKIITAPKELRTDIDGTVFDSKEELKRYKDLQVLQRDGQIRELYTQQEFTLKINNIDVGKYTCDFIYQEKTKDGIWVEIFEDYKGFYTSESKFRIKIFEAIYGVKVRITGPAKTRTRKNIKIPATILKKKKK